MCMQIPTSQAIRLDLEGKVVVSQNLFCIECSLTLTFVYTGVDRDKAAHFQTNSVTFGPTHWAGTMQRQHCPGGD